MPDIPSEVSAMLTSLSYAHRGVASFELYPTDGDKTFYVSGSGSPSYMTVSAEYAHSRNPFFPIVLSPSGYGVTFDSSAITSTTAATYTPVTYYTNP